MATYFYKVLPPIWLCFTSFFVQSKIAKMIWMNFHEFIGRNLSINSQLDSGMIWIRIQEFLKNTF